MLDSFYTPNVIAEEVVSFYDGKPRLIGDFCAGDGGLLRVCEARFPQAHYYANDKSKRAYRVLVKDHPNWQIFNIDFLSDKRLQDLRHLYDSFDLVLLNPPFTCRGKVYKFSFDGFEFSASKALLFLVRSIRFLAKGGALIAILPIGVIISERDARLITYLKKVYGFHIHRKVSGISFAGKEPNIVLAELRRPFVLPKFSPVKKEKRIYPFLYRGRCNVGTAHSLGTRKGIAFVHTTNLIDGKIGGINLKMRECDSQVLFGPAVLVPRVGTPNTSKIVLIKSGEKYVLSDCVIGILSNDNSSACHILHMLSSNKAGLFRLYAGTGARYITLSRLGAYIMRIITPQCLRNV